MKLANILISKDFVIKLADFGFAKFSKENKADHAVVQGILRGMHKTIYRTEDKIDKVSDKLSGHLENHQK